MELDEVAPQRDGVRTYLLPQVPLRDPAGRT